MSESDVIKAVLKDPLREQIVRAVATLSLPNHWVAGGFVRNAFWDQLYGVEGPTPINDVDVVYYKPLDSYGLPEVELIALIEAEEPNPVWEEEKEAERALGVLFPDLEFEVKNQARMHLSRARLVGRPQYTDVVAAIADWVETATGTGIRVAEDGSFEVLGAHGFDDLFVGIVRPTNPALTERTKERAEKKGWYTRWPKLRFEEAA